MITSFHWNKLFTVISRQITSWREREYRIPLMQTLGYSGKKCPMYAIMVLGYELLHDKTQHLEVVPSKDSDLNFFLHPARTLIWWFSRLTWISSVSSQIIGFFKHGLLLILFVLIHLVQVNKHFVIMFVMMLYVPVMFRRCTVLLGWTGT